MENETNEIQEVSKTNEKDAKIQSRRGSFRVGYNNESRLIIF